jgi:hypothetical protein
MKSAGAKSFETPYTYEKTSAVQNYLSEHLKN